MGLQSVPKGHPVGHSFILRIRGSHMAQAWLFGVCAVLCLVQGEDVLRCKKCVLKSPYEDCHGICEVSGKDSVCYTEKTYKGRNTWHLIQKTLGCFKDPVYCRPTGYGYDISYKYCCSDGDYCNSKL